MIKMSTRATGDSLEPKTLNLHASRNEASWHWNLRHACNKWCSILNVHLPTKTLVKDNMRGHTHTHTHTHTHRRKSAVELKLLASECSCAPVALTTSRGEMRQSHHPTPWLIHQLTYTHSQQAKSTDRHACVCTYEPNVHSDRRAYCVKLCKCYVDMYRSRHIHPLPWNNTRSHRHTHTHTHTYTHTPRSIPALTVTDPLADKSPHASGRAWCWGPPSSPSRAPRHINTPHTHFIVGLRLHTRAHTHTHLTSLSENPSTHTSAGIFFHSLSPYLLSLSLALPASLLLPSAASRPIRREVTS